MIWILLFQIRLLLALFCLTSVCSLQPEMPQTTVRVAERVWRAAALQHKREIVKLLQPGLIPSDDPRIPKRNRRNDRGNENWMTPLDPKHPVYNFLIEYYGLKGAKGPKQLARWSPSPSILLGKTSKIESTNEFDQLSRKYKSVSKEDFQSNQRHASILLEGASSDDFAETLHLRGAIIEDSEDGVLYNPSLFFNRDDPDYRQDASKQATPFLWYQSILRQTLSAEPILHCHGLHEWAMQYQPEGAPPPPSAKYQAHLPLRVSRDVINAAVERRGVSCTHVDALRFFAPAAGPLNHHGASLERMDQLRLEQPACVHAHMDMLKICLKLKPFCDPVLVQEVLAVALKSRRLDVAASPYDATSYGVGVVPIEEEDGRAEYRKQQRQLMKEAEVVRKDLLKAYDLLLTLGFSDDVLNYGSRNPLAERYAVAEPGGKPWRQNLIER